MTKQLPVVYFSQRNNHNHQRNQAHRTCNSTSCWMGAMYMHPELWQECGESNNADFDFYLPKVEQYGDTTSHLAQTQALKDLGVDSTWRCNLSLTDVRMEINEGRPVVLGVLHRGSVSNPRGGGHMILAVGYDDKGLFIHDPYGDLDLVRGGYPIPGGGSGAYLHYSDRNLQPRFEVEGPGTGWGRTFKATPG